MISRSLFKQITEKEWIPFLVPISVSFLVSLVAAHLIVIHEEEENFIELFAVPAYYPALGWSTIMAWLVIGVACWMNAYPIIKFKNVKNLNLRVVYRFGIGTLCLLLLCIAMALVYFSCYKKPIGDTNYFSRLFVIIACMVLCLNGFFTAYFFKKTNPEWFVVEKGGEVKRRRGWLRRAVALAKRKRSSSLPPPVKPDMVLFYYHERFNFAVSEDGSEEVWPYTNKRTFELLPHQDYFFISRTFIVKRSNIEEVTQASSHRRKLKLKVPAGKSVVVSQGRTPLFILWWAGELRPDQYHLMDDFD
ncbi:hypothetical protein DBR11_09275 [Pedobacter sp. HMWF019]|uniref:LytTR family transcriptional regulator DNA-binding domain-containing protein n=1 Tax=Pedobacter sp. HMWF019 TaxID=2056856 RepID=UPI000D374B54|nr:LytTR family transcriptional regulator DNA-binding domain-containing protein [Pedobacter sp. HMWF019]PTT00711.1 hypothetical protein DBR11_09275 [Pedobacter sp. HMWF019]